MGSGSETIAARLSVIRERIEIATSRVGRQPEEVTLVAVSKNFPAGAIGEAFAAGVRHFGENRIQEWELKAPQVADFEATWHLVGHLQRNKAGRAAALFQHIDSLDSVPLAEKLDRAAAGRSRPLPVLLEVRLDPAVTKSGCEPGEVARLVEGILLMPNLDLQGLMTIPPVADDPEMARPVFRRLRELRDEISAHIGRPLPELSMGMSSDFEIAIEEGATQIRVGRALFGERPKVL